MVGGKLFTSYAAHPAKRVAVRMGGRTIYSTAAGAYQFLSRTWNECRDALLLPDFSPASQDRAAAFLIKRRGAYRDVLEGRFYTAVRKCAKEWASLPGSPYGQPTLQMDEAAEIFQRFGGVITEGE